VKVSVSVEKPAAGARASVFPEGLAGSFENPRIVGEPEVVVGTHHHAALPLDHDFRSVGLLDGQEIRIKPEGFYLLWPRIGIRLGEHVRVLADATVGLAFGRGGGVGKTDSALRSRIHEALASPESVSSHRIRRRYVTGLII